MSTHSICCHEEIKKKLYGYNLLSEAMYKTKAALDSNIPSRYITLKQRLLNIDSTSDIK